MEDLLYLRGIDVAVTQADVFDYFRNQRKVPNLESQASSAEFTASGAPNLNQDQREALFREFLRWQDNQRSARPR